MVVQRGCLLKETKKPAGETTPGGGMIMPYRLKTKIWLEKNGHKVFGDGPYDILNRVEQLGSLRQAAAQINMSYSQAWRLIKMLERNLGFPILVKRVGGPGGGCSILTPQAKELSEAYRAFRHDADHALNSIYHEHFSRLSKKKNG